METSQNSSKADVAALIVAAGRGVRAGHDLPKQYVRLGDRTVLQRTIEALLSHPAVSLIQVVIAEGDAELYRSAVGDTSKLLPPIAGGATRQESVKNGLEALAEHAPRLVLVHDAARPFVTADVVENVIVGCDADHGAIPVLPVTETVKRIEDSVITATVPRDALGTAQTPQGFPFAALLKAHRDAWDSGRTELTDDAAVFALAGLTVRAVEGDRRNIKLTNPADFAAAERMLTMAIETRTGQGFDVHTFGDGSAVWLCGVEIPHDRALVGHSDADVGLHALTDALLGTIGDGDIGEHFPPSDPKWKGASSDQFLVDAVRRVHDKGGRIVNVDVTLVCEAPRIGPHREAMQERIAELAGIGATRVGVKATTNEKMGFIGRGEGIVALAIATVALPAES